MNIGNTYKAQYTEFLIFLNILKEHLIKHLVRPYFFQIVFLTINFTIIFSCAYAVRNFVFVTPDTDVEIVGCIISQSTVEKAE